MKAKMILLAVVSAGAANAQSVGDLIPANAISDAEAVAITAEAKASQPKVFDLMKNDLVNGLDPASVKCKDGNLAPCPSSVMLTPSGVAFSLSAGGKAYPLPAAEQDQGPVSASVSVTTEGVPAEVSVEVPAGDAQTVQVDVNADGGEVPAVVEVPETPTPPAPVTVPDISVEQPAASVNVITVPIETPAKEGEVLLVEPGKESVTLRAKWDNASDDAKITVSKPDGTLLDEVQMAAEGMRLGKNADNTLRQVIINSPEAGEWVITVNSSSELGKVSYSLK